MGLAELKNEVAGATGGKKRVGEYVLGCINEQNANLIEGKTLNGCWAKIVAGAKIKAFNNCACLEDSEVFSVASEYFGLNGSEPIKAENNVVVFGAGINIDILDFI